MDHLWPSAFHFCRWWVRTFVRGLARRIGGSTVNSLLRHRCPSSGRFDPRGPSGSPGSSDDPQVCHSRRAKVNAWLSGFPHTSTRAGPNIGGMQRLSGLDASFLYLETAAQPLHVCSILEIDTSTIPGGYTFDRLRDALGLRIKAMPEFREKLADNRFNLDHPVWVEDKDFDVDRHLHRIGLPSPGGRVELGEICGHIASLNLDRSRPLWEMWVIENVAGTDAHDGGRLAVHDEGAPRRRRRRHRRQPDVAAVHHRTRRAAAGPGRRGRRRVGPGDRGQRRDQVRHPPAQADERAALDAVDGGGHRQAGAQRADHGGAVRRTEDPLQRQRHRAPQRRVRPARPRGHQDRQEPLRRQGQRRRDGVGGRSAAAVPARPATSCPTTRSSRWFRCRCTTSRTGPGATRFRACSPAWRPTSRTRRSG